LVGQAERTGDRNRDKVTMRDRRQVYVGRAICELTGYLTRDLHC
jgi:hypothetical protein